MADAIPVVHKHLPAVKDGVNIVIVGAGGTGGLVARQTIQLMGGLRDDIKPRIALTVIDADTFEVKNLGRQLCTERDIGKNKAEVITCNCTAAFNVTMSPVSYIPEFVKEEKDITSLLNTSYNNIIIDCLDKTNPRKIIHNALKSAIASRRSLAAYLISSGNSEYEGQVSWGVAIKDEGKMRLFSNATRHETSPYTFSVPMPYTRMPLLMDPAVDKKEASLSCGDRAAQNVQTVAANQTAATLVFNYVNAIIKAFTSRVTEIPIVPLTCGEIYFNSLRNTYNSNMLTSNFLKGELF